MLRVERVSAAYGKRDVLRDVSFAARPGEIVSILGPNGAGKSSLLRVVAGFLAAAQGQVQFRGEPLGPHPAHRRVGLGIGYALQGGRIFPSLRVVENLSLAAAALSPAGRAEALAFVLDFLPTLEPLTERRAGLLSGGERHFLALGMVLARRPSLLLLDEPTAGVAPGAAAELLERVRLYAEEERAAVLLVEQRVEPALAVAHRALVLANGAVITETDSPAAWLDSGELERLYLGPVGPGAAA